jgi:hypothetical protein
MSLWKLVLYSTYIALKLPGALESKEKDAWAEIVKIMLIHGVDPNAKCSQEHYLGLVNGLGRRYEV